VVSWRGHNTIVDLLDEPPVLLRVGRCMWRLSAGYDPSLVSFIYSTLRVQWRSSRVDIVAKAFMVVELACMVNIRLVVSFFKVILGAIF